MAIQIAVGNNIYLHQVRVFDPNDPPHLLISSHGMVLPDSFRVPDWAQLYFYGKHGAAITDPGFHDIIRGRYQVTESVAGGEKSHNYLLSKFQGSHGEEKETYKTLQADIARNSGWLDDMYARAQSGDKYKMEWAHEELKKRNFAFHFDVLTIRHRLKRLTLGVTLALVLRQLESKGYKYLHIHCSFCRWRPGGGSVDPEKWGT